MIPQVLQDFLQNLSDEDSDLIEAYLFNTHSANMDMLSFIQTYRRNKYEKENRT